MTGKKNDHDAGESAAPGPALTTVCVAVATRQRPLMLARLLASWSRLELPAGQEFLFVVVENGPAAGAEAVVAGFAAAIGERAGVVFAREPRLGIPFARNRALDIALGRGCDWLAFMDDDAEADPDWIAALVAEADRRGLDLAGAPQRFLAPESDLSLRERRCFEALVRRQQRKEMRAAARCAAGTDGVVTAITNNWLARLSFVAARGLRFDETLGLSGGSDTRFFHSLKAAGGATGWIPSAIVRETLPRTRLTLSYQYRRGRDQAIASFHNHRRRHRPDEALRNVITGLWRVLASSALLALAPLTGWRTAASGARGVGAGIGRLQAAFGRRSLHYRDVHGE